MKYKTSYYNFYTDHFPEGKALRLVYLSDLHNDRCRGLAGKIAALQPDYILVGGDMVTAHKRGGEVQYDRVLPFLKRISRICPVICSPGNHETRWACSDEENRKTFQEYLRWLKANHILYLSNESTEIDTPGGKVRITGLELPLKAYRRTAAAEQWGAEVIESYIGRKRSGMPEILLAHSPLFFQGYTDRGAELTLAGHYHGGMVRLPFLGGIISPYFKLFPAYDKGCFRQNGKCMIVGAGLGIHTLPFRFMNPREIPVITIQGGRADIKEESAWSCR